MTTNFWGVVVSQAPPPANREGKWYSVRTSFANEPIYGGSIRGTELVIGQQVDIITCGQRPWPEFGFIEKGYGSAYLLPNWAREQAFQQSPASVALAWIANQADKKELKYQPAEVLSVQSTTLTVKLRWSQQTVADIGFDSPYTAGLATISASDFKQGDTVLIGRFGQTLFCVGWWYPTEKDSDFWMVWASFVPSGYIGQTQVGKPSWHAQSYRNGNFSKGIPSTPTSPIYSYTSGAGPWIVPTYQSYRAYTRTDGTNNYELNDKNSEWITVCPNFPYYMAGNVNWPVEILSFSKLTRQWYGIKNPGGHQSPVSQVCFGGGISAPYTKSQPYVLVYEGTFSGVVPNSQDNTNDFRVINCITGNVAHTINKYLLRPADEGCFIDGLMGLSIVSSGGGYSNWSFVFGNHSSSFTFGEMYQVMSSGPDINNASWMWTPPFSTHSDWGYPSSLLYYIPELNKCVAANDWGAPVLIDPYDIQYSQPPILKDDSLYLYNDYVPPVFPKTDYQPPDVQFALNWGQFPDYGSFMADGKIMADHRRKRSNTGGIIDDTGIYKFVSSPYERTESGIVIPDNPDPSNLYFQNSYLILPF